MRAFLRKCAYSAKRIWVWRLRGLGLTSRPISYRQYLDLQLEKSADPDRRKIWLGDEWEPKVQEFERVLRELFRKWDFNPSKALFVGARTGQEVEAALRLEVDAVGIDLIEAPPYVVIGDMHDIPFPADSFDFVFSNCFDHALYPERMVAELERVTSPGGIICVQVQVDKEDDKYGVTDLFDLESLTDLFRDSEILISRRLPQDVLAMNGEVVARVTTVGTPKDVL